MRNHIPFWTSSLRNSYPLPSSQKFHHRSRHQPSHPSQRENTMKYRCLTNSQCGRIWSVIRWIPNPCPCSTGHQKLAPLRILSQYAPKNKLIFVLHDLAMYSYVLNWNLQPIFLRFLVINSCLEVWNCLRNPLDYSTYLISQWNMFLLLYNCTMRLFNLH